jgi:uncharacterized membrane protein
MRHSADLQSLLDRWLAAGVVDQPTAERIRAFESRRPESRRLRWPMMAAMGMGGLLLGAGILLFVAAHWDTLSPGARFALVLLLVAGFHVAGALLSSSLPVLSSTLHTLGTTSLGAGIFLAGQIFNLQEHWPTGILLWAIGAGFGWLLLRSWPQAMLLALTVPAWLTGEWFVAVEKSSGIETTLIPAAGTLGLAITYLTARTRAHAGPVRETLAWIGGITVIPHTVWLGLAATEYRHAWARSTPVETSLTSGTLIVGFVCAFGLPLLLAYLLRGRDAVFNLVATLWVWLLGAFGLQHGPDWMVYPWYAVGAIGLVAWGVHESSRQRINLGMAGFALAVMGFYSSSVMDRMDRAMSLIVGGVLFLGGGWLLERARRRLVGRLGESSQ